MTTRKPTPTELDAWRWASRLSAQAMPESDDSVFRAADAILKIADRIRAERLALNPDSYESPAHGWTCFHCGETFHEQQAACDHFGATQLAEAACRIKDGDERTLVQKYRQLEAQMAAIVEEDTEEDRRIGAVHAQHTVALRAHGDAEYARGLEDGIKHADRIRAERAELEVER